MLKRVHSFLCLPSSQFLSYFSLKTLISFRLSFHLLQKSLKKPLIKSKNGLKWTRGQALSLMKIQQVNFSASRLVWKFQIDGQMRRESPMTHTSDTGARPLYSVAAEKYFPQECSVIDKRSKWTDVFSKFQNIARILWWSEWRILNPNLCCVEPPKWGPRPFSPIKTREPNSSGSKPFCRVLDVKKTCLNLT